MFYMSTLPSTLILMSDMDFISIVLSERELSSYYRMELPAPTIGFVVCSSNMLNDTFEAGTNTRIVRSARMLETALYIS